MRKLIVSEIISLDGVFQAPGAPEEDPLGDFRFRGWAAPYDDEALGHAAEEQFSQPFELLLGRRTYDIFASFWPGVPAGHPVGDIYNRVRKHVATHRPDSLHWQNSHALVGDLVDAVRALKNNDGADLWTNGSGDMVRQLLAAGLVDELRLQTFPVLLGRGKRLFDDTAAASAFDLQDSSVTPGGVVLGRYVRGGEVRTGTWGS
jgi:dihydrofolate reductase